MIMDFVKYCLVHVIHIDIILKEVGSLIEQSAPQFHNYICTA